MMKGLIIALALVSFCLALPLESQKQLNVDEELQVQALVALHKSNSPGKFKQFVPLVNHAIVYTGAVLPFVKAKKEHKKTHELTESMLVQTFADAAGAKISDLEKALPTAEDMLTAMAAVGNVVGGSSGFNPIEMMSNIVGKEQMVAMIDEVMKFPLRFPEPSEEQLGAAEQVVLAIGLGFGDQETAINKFISSMSKEQTEMITSLQQNVIEKLMNSMMTPNGDPSPVLIEEIKRQMKEMEEKKGSTEMMPQELKDLVPTAATTTKEETQGALISTETTLAHHEDAAKILDTAIQGGNFLRPAFGVNPVALMTKVVGQENMKSLLSDMFSMAQEFPSLTKDQLSAAQALTATIATNSDHQLEAFGKFVLSLSQIQLNVISRVEQKLFKTLKETVTGSNKEFSALIQEVNKEGSVPVEAQAFEELSKMFSSVVGLAHDQQQKENFDKQAHIQALVAINPTSEGKFKQFVPLVNHAVVYAGAVLPFVKAKKEHKKTHELTESMLVQTFADAAGAKISDLEKALPTAEDLLTAMVAVGNVVGGSSGFNPIEMMSNIVGKEQMVAMIDEVMKFPLRFPEPSEEQLGAAEQVVLAIGLGFGDQETAINKFISSMSKEQSEMITSLQQNVIEKLMNSMTTPNGDPSPALVEEIKRQMREMEEKKGSTEMMPQELKDLVAEQATKSVTSM